MAKLAPLNPGWGWICILLGLYPIAIAAGILEVDPDKLHAPPWVLALCGLVFIIAGCMALLGQHGRVNDSLAALILLAFALVGVWVSLFSSAEGFSGGLPFVSQEMNILLQRCIFGLGALICLSLFVYAVRRAINPDR
tara:strand:+ start:347 stop:760 length:414 start_codon:yes stop_codon:yes gene_type:complete